jgi:hypothetical protein
MNIASRLNEHKRVVRIIILAVFIVTMFGPWIFDRIMVPAEYKCSLPNIRLNDDFCGMPLSGFRFFELFVGGIFYMLLDLTKGAFINHPRELLIGLSILPLIPFFISLFLVWRKETRRTQTINLIAWILAFLPALTMFIAQLNDQITRLWGLWLYILLAVSAIIFESILLKRQTGAP